MSVETLLGILFWLSIFAFYFWLLYRREKRFSEAMKWLQEDSNKHLINIERLQEDSKKSEPSKHLANERKI